MRISVVGNSGSGKSTAARKISMQLGIPRLELDAIRHQANWEELPDAEFYERVEEFVATHDTWVIDGNYRSVVQDVVWRAADTIVWLDLPRSQNMRNIIWRTVSRAALRTELWNGNRERWQNLFSLDPYKSMIAWAWTRHGSYRERYGAAQCDPCWSHLDFVRLDSREALDAWLTAFAAATEREQAKEQ